MDGPFSLHFVIGQGSDEMFSDEDLDSVTGERRKRIKRDKKEKIESFCITEIYID